MPSFVELRNAGRKSHIVPVKARNSQLVCVFPDVLGVQGTVLYKGPANDQRPTTHDQESTTNDEV